METDEDALENVSCTKTRPCTSKNILLFSSCHLLFKIYIALFDMLDIFLHHEVYALPLHFFIRRNKALMRRSVLF